MNNGHIHWLLSVALIFLVSGLKAQNHSAMTYNIRYNNVNDGEDQWDNRKTSLVKEILFYEPDFIGIQEGLHEQVQYLDESLAQYTYIGVGRDDGKTKGEYSAVFYHTDRVKLLEDGTFWLSETPENPSVGWDASMERICTYGYFKYKKGGDKIWVFNTHFDHRGHEARKESAKLIIQKIEELATSGEPVLLSGDFNLAPETEAIQMLSKKFQDSYTHSGIAPLGPSGTFSGFDVNRENTHRIDYIFANDEVEIKKTAILSHWIDRHFNSDHFPVITQFNIK